MNSIVNLLVVGAAIIGFFFLEETKGPMLPDDLYCEIGAGQRVVSPGTKEPSRFDADGDPIAWKYTPSRERCVHGTILDAMEASQAGEPVSALIARRQIQKVIQNMEKAGADQKKAQDKAAETRARDLAADRTEQGRVYAQYDSITKQGTNYQDFQKMTSVQQQIEAAKTKQQFVELTNRLDKSYIRNWQCTTTDVRIVSDIDRNVNHVPFAWVLSCKYSNSQEEYALFFTSDFKQATAIQRGDVVHFDGTIIRSRTSLTGIYSCGLYDNEPPRCFSVREARANNWTILATDRAGIEINSACTRAGVPAISCAK